MKPKILVAREIFPEVLERLAQHFEVESNQLDESWSPAQISAKLQGKWGILTMAGERIDASVLAS
jgi:gluconate 2-dehydrogenase